MSINLQIYYLKTETLSQLFYEGSKSYLNHSFDVMASITLGSPTIKPTFLFNKRSHINQQMSFVGVNPYLFNLKYRDEIPVRGEDHMV